MAENKIRHFLWKQSIFLVNRMSHVQTDFENFSLHENVVTEAKAYRNPGEPGCFHYIVFFFGTHLFRGVSRSFCDKTPPRGSPKYEDLARGEGTNYLYLHLTFFCVRHGFWAGDFRIVSPINPYKLLKLINHQSKRLVNPVVSSSMISIIFNNQKLSRW